MANKINTIESLSLYYIQDNLVNEYNKQRLNWR